MLIEELQFLITTILRENAFQKFFQDLVHAYVSLHMYIITRYL
jgi:hypothetical protein